MDFFSFLKCTLLCIISLHFMFTVEKSNEILLQCLIMEKLNDESSRLKSHKSHEKIKWRKNKIKIYKRDTHKLMLELMSRVNGTRRRFKSDWLKNCEKKFVILNFFCYVWQSWWCLHVHFFRSHRWMSHKKRDMQENKKKFKKVSWMNKRKQIVQFSSDRSCWWSYFNSYCCCAV